MVGPRLERPDGIARPRGEALLPHPAERARPLHAASAAAGTPTARSPPTARPRSESGPVDAVNGAFMLMRRSAFEAAGGFDEGYWMYMEDLDLSYRLAQAGWLSWYEPAATVRHVKGGTVGGPRPPRLNWHFHRGMYRFYRSHYAPQRSPVLNAARLRRDRGEAGGLGRSVVRCAGASRACAIAGAPRSPARAGRRAPAAADRARTGLPARSPWTRPRIGPRLRSTTAWTAACPTSRTSTPGSRPGESTLHLRSR